MRRFLTEQDACTLHKPRRIRFPRRKTYSKGIGDLYQIDLVDLSSLASHNDCMRYLLTCIDVFSKRAWAIPVRTKSARDVTRAFEIVLEDGKCNMVQSDKGTEFLNSTFQTRTSRLPWWNDSTERSRRKCFAISHMPIRDDTWTCCRTCCIRTTTRTIDP